MTTPADNENLLPESGSALCDLSARARKIRDTGKGRVITFSAKIFIPLTRLCRNSCGYCDYQTREEAGRPPFLSPEDVFTLARIGELAGCTEALFVAGDKPELRYPAARRWLSDHHYDSTPHYASEMAQWVASETRLYPHTNVGIATSAELRDLCRVNVSIGLMLETTSERFRRAGGAHFMSPDKEPDVRRRFIARAGELQIPLTTGLLVGIGETRNERFDALLAIRQLSETFGHIQELIVQNFQPKPGTHLESLAPPTRDELAWTVAMARLILGPHMNIQVPPNLAGATGSYGFWIEAGINDWGGISPVTRDGVNRRTPWPHIDELRRATEAAGYTLRHRFPVYPEFIARARSHWDPKLRERLEKDMDQEGYVQASRFAD